MDRLFLRDNSVAEVVDLTGEPVHSQIQFRVKLVAYFCVHNIVPVRKTIHDSVIVRIWTKGQCPGPIYSKAIRQPFGDSGEANQRAFPLI